LTIPAVHPTLKNTSARAGGLHSADHGLRRSGTAMMVTLTVNGEPRTVDVQPDMPLLWVLRDVLDLKGTKFGCGVRRCGACTVHMNGAPTRTCTLAISEAEGVRTIEGLSEDGSHPVQRAWQDLDVAQCGYCQAGQIMTAVSLLERNPEPTDEDIDRAMGNLCRCGTYLRIRQAIHTAATLQATEAGSGQGRDGSGDINS
jgi:isoquinoline 1-oxidoreductase alpha subunit